MNYDKIDSPTLLLTAPGHPTHHVRERDIFRIGREKSNDLVLVDPTVSRKHAFIKWDGRYPIITDLKSTSGLLVDGKHVRYAHLHSLHTLALGDSTIHVEFACNQASTPTELENPTMSSALLHSLDELDEATLFHEYGSKDQTGFLETTEKIQDFLIYLEANRRTGTLTLTSNSITGRVIFAAGKIKQVLCGSLCGTHALQQLCCLPSAAYHFTVIFDVQETHLNVSAAKYMKALRKAPTMRRPRTPSGFFKRAPRIGKNP